MEVQVESTHTDALRDAAECLKTMAHPHRLRMLRMMLDSRYTVGGVASACGVVSQVASDHLRIMKDRGLLGREREGNRIYYHVARKQIADVVGCFGSH